MANVAQRLRTRATGETGGAKERRFARSLVLPGVVVLLGVSVYPLLYSLRVSVTDYNLLSIGAAKFVALGNYIDVFLHDPEFWAAARVTAVFLASVVLLQIPLGLALATFVNGLSLGRRLVATVLVIPMVLSPSVVAFEWFQIYNQQFGPLGYLLQNVGLAAPAWLASPGSALVALVITDFWQWLPLPFLLCLGGLQSIPQRDIEAAQVDGSTKGQVFRYIKLPMLRQFIAIALILRLIEEFKNIGLVYVMTQGGPGTSTETLAYYTYKSGLVHFDIGYAAALAVIQMIVIVLLVKGILGQAERAA